MFDFDQHPDPILPWLKDKTLPKPVKTQLHRWLDAHSYMIDALRAESHLERWSQGQSKHAPDNLFWIIAKYGQTRAITRTWKALPIQPPDAEAEAWRAYRWGTTLREFHTEQLAVAGGFLSSAVLKPEEVADLLIEQMDAKLSEITSLADKPLSYYSSETFSWGAEALLVDAGIVSQEKRRLNRPFTLRDEMEYFISGMEDMRMYAMTERNEELGLPSMPLFDALCRVPLHRIFATVEKVDPKLKRILQHLAKQGQIAITEDATAPDVIWWRHWREHEEKERHQRSEHGGHTSRGKG